MTTTPAVGVGLDVRQEEPIDINEATVALRVTFHQWGVDRKIRADQYQVDADKRRTHAHKKLIDCPEYRALEKLSWTARDRLERMALTCSALGRGRYMIPVGMIPKAKAYLDEVLLEHARLLDAFMAVYAEQKRVAALPADQGGLGSLFDESQYPPEATVRAKFRVYTTWQPTFPATPDALAQVVGVAFFDDERAKVAQELRDSVSEIRAGLLAEVREMTGRIVDRLGYGDDGKPKVFTKTLTANLVSWLDDLESRDITGFKALRDQAKAMRMALAGLTYAGDEDAQLKALRSDPSVRDFVRTQFEKINAALAELPVETKGREIDLDEE